jgi:hypothetical protein
VPTLLKKVDFIAREPHHVVHAKAVYDALPYQYRGIFTSSVEDLSKSGNEYCAAFSFGDLKLANIAEKKTIYADHGVGFFFNTSHPSYAGSAIGRENCILRLSPNEMHAKKERETLPCPVEVVGVPMMDKWANVRDTVSPYNPKVAISFHWDGRVVPETRSALAFYLSALPELKEKYTLIGHGHPRVMNFLEDVYRSHGILIERDFDKVLKECDVYVCDASSTIYQAAFAKKAVVLLNCKHYRKNVEHEGNPRFWKYADIGPQVERASELVDAVERAVKFRHKYLPRIKEANEAVFSFLDGKCGERAANAIIKAITQ